MYYILPARCAAIVAVLPPDPPPFTARAIIRAKHITKNSPARASAPIVYFVKIF